MSETTLKLCPFCGGKAYVAKGLKDRYGFYHSSAVCDNPECQASVDGIPRKNPDESMRDAAERWNLRAERTCHVAHLVDEFGDVAEVCSECGFGNVRDRFTAQPFRFCPNCGARVVKE